MLCNLRLGHAGPHPRHGACRLDERAAAEKSEWQATSLQLARNHLI